MLFYSAKTNQIYNAECKDGLPKDTVEINEKLYREIMIGLSSGGKKLASDHNGYPKLFNI